MTDLPPLDVGPRVDSVCYEMENRGLDTLVVSSPANIRYLSGFVGSHGTLVVRRSAEAVLITDARYTDRAVEEGRAVGAAHRVETLEGDTMAEATVAQCAGSVGLDTAHLCYDDYEALYRLLEREPIHTTGLVETIRAVKTDAEVARISRAASFADAALEEVAPMLVDEPLERDVALELDYLMRRLGADDVGYEPIVASGPNAAIPHHEPGRRPIRDADMVIIDTGAQVEGYRSDMTRCFPVGDPGDRAREIYEVVSAAQAAGVAAVAEGVDAREVDDACRGLIADAGFGDAFVHGAGHGVGLDIHEEPAVSARSETSLIAGHVLTVEPGIYIPGFGGARVEDTVLVTADGAEALTLAPKLPATF